MTIGQFIRVSRPPTLAATVVPMLVGGATAWLTGHFVLWAWLTIVFIGFLLQIGANMLNEYFDFRQGLDSVDSLGIGGIIVSGEVPARTVLVVAAACYGLALVLGIALVIFRGPILLLMGVGGALAGYLYAGGPYPISATPLGEMMVFWVMGPLEVLATQLTVSGEITKMAWVVSWPVGFLVAAILLANNLRDRVKDGQHGRRTLPVLFGPRAGMRILALFIIAAFLVVTTAAAAHIIPRTALIVWLALPLAWTTWTQLRRGQRWAQAVPLVGRLHVVMGVLLAAGLVIGH